MAFFGQPTSNPQAAATPTQVGGLFQQPSANKPTSGFFGQPAPAAGASASTQPPGGG